MTHWALAAAKALRNLIEAIPHTKGPLGTEHLLSMLDRMDDSMSVGKLNRWLGWIQASVVAHGFSDLDHMKAHNKHFSDEQKSSQKEYPTCDRCGSLNVSADAAARWDHEKQDWTVTNVFDKGHSCDNSDDESKIEWTDGDPPEEKVPPATVEETETALLLVGDVDTDNIDVEAWTDEQRSLAYDWAMAVHFHASDNEDVVVPPQPDFIPRKEFNDL